MEPRQELSPAAFGGIALLVVAVVVATPLLFRRRSPQPEQLPVVEAPPVEEPPPPPEPEPPAPGETLRGTVSFDAERGWILVQGPSARTVVPAGALVGVEPLPGGREELIVLRDGRRIQAPVGFVAGLPREVRYRFDYGRSGNVDPNPPVDEGE